MANNYPVLGGVSLELATQIHRDATGIQFAWKNLFHVAIESPVASDAVGQAFNFFCTGVEYSPRTLNGEKRIVGSASVDALRTSDPVELRLTTMDDRDGVIKRWFIDLADMAAPADGTVNPPASYATRIRVKHAQITSDDGSFDGLSSILTDYASNFVNGLVSDLASELTGGLVSVSSRNSSSTPLTASSGAFVCEGLYRPGSIDLSLSRMDRAVEEFNLSFFQLDTFMDSSSVPLSFSIDLNW